MAVSVINRNQGPVAPVSARLESKVRMPIIMSGSQGPVSLICPVPLSTDRYMAVLPVEVKDIV